MKGPFLSAPPRREDDEAADDTRHVRRVSRLSIVHHHHNPFVVQYYISGDLNKLFASSQVSDDKNAPGTKRKRPVESDGQNDYGSNDYSRTHGESSLDGDQRIPKRHAPQNMPHPKTTSHNDVMNRSDSMSGLDNLSLTDQHMLIAAIIKHHKSPMSAPVLQVLRDLVSKQDDARAETHEMDKDGPHRVRFDRSDHFSRAGGQYNEGYDRPIDGREGQWEFASYGLGFREMAGSAEAHAKLSYGNQELFPDVEFPTPQELYASGIAWSRDTQNLVWVPDDEREKLMGKRLHKDLTYRYRLLDGEDVQAAGDRGSRKQDGVGVERNGGGGLSHHQTPVGASTSADPRDHNERSEARQSNGSKEDADGEPDKEGDLVSRRDGSMPLTVSTPVNGTKAPITAHQQIFSNRTDTPSRASKPTPAPQIENDSAQGKRKPSFYYVDKNDPTPLGKAVDVYRRPEDNPGAVTDQKRESKKPVRYGDPPQNEDDAQENQKGRAPSVASTQTKGRPRKASTATGKRPSVTPKSTLRTQPKRVPKPVVETTPNDQIKRARRRNAQPGTDDAKLHAAAVTRADAPPTNVLAMQLLVFMTDGSRQSRPTMAVAELTVWASENWSNVDQAAILAAVEYLEARRLVRTEGPPGPGLEVVLPSAADGPSEEDELSDDEVAE